MSIRDRHIARRALRIALAVLAAQLCGRGPGYAGGLQTLPAHARGSALGSATVALSSDPEEFSRNPALLGSSEGTRLTLGAGLLIPEYRFTGARQSDVETKSEPAFLFPPSFALSIRIDERFSVGLSAGAPFLARSEWDPGWVGRQLSTSFEHRTGVLCPAVAFTPLEGVSLGVSIPLSLTKHVMTSWIVYPGAGGNPGETYQKTIEGESSVMAGFQAGVLIFGGIWSFGGSYALGADPAISDAEASLSTPNPEASRETYTGRQASISMSLPAELAVGATVRALPGLLLTTEFDLVMWSSSEEIRYEIPGTPDGYVIPQGWEDSYRIALGAEYRLSELDLRAGFSYDTSPVPDATVHPAYPDADRYGYSVGLGYRVGPGLLLDFGITGFAFKERSVEGSELTVTDEVTGETGQAFNGTYRTGATSVSIGVSYLWR